MNGIIAIVILLVLAHAVFSMAGMKNLVPRLLKFVLRNVLQCFIGILKIFFDELGKLVK